MTDTPTPGLAVWRRADPGRPPADCDWRDWRFADPPARPQPDPETDPCSTH